MALYSIICRPSKEFRGTEQHWFNFNIRSLSKISNGSSHWCRDAGEIVSSQLPNMVLYMIYMDAADKIQENGSHRCLQSQQQCMLKSWSPIIMLFRTTEWIHYWSKFVGFGNKKLMLRMPCESCLSFVIWYVRAMHSFMMIYSRMIFKCRTLGTEKILFNQVAIISCQQHRSPFW